jgi:hypothetical protein
MIKSSTVFDLNLADHHLCECKKDLIIENHAPNVYLISAKMQMLTPERELKRKTAGLTSTKTKVKVKCQRLMIDCLICLAFINFEWNEWELSNHAFGQAYKVSS